MLPDFLDEDRVIALCSSIDADSKVGDPVTKADRVAPSTMSLELGGGIMRRPEGLFNFSFDRPTFNITKFVLVVPLGMLEA